MSARRVFAAVAIVAVAVACTPAALVPVFNSADLICAASPLALLAVLSRRPKTPAGGADALGDASTSGGRHVPGGITQEGQDR